MNTRVTVDGIERSWNLPTTRIRTLDPPVETGQPEPWKLPIGIATERGEDGIWSWWGLLAADEDDFETTVRMDLSEIPPCR